MRHKLVAAISLASLTLAACGGGTSSDTNTEAQSTNTQTTDTQNTDNTSNVEITQAAKGSEVQPALSTAEVSEGSDISLNSQSSGAVDGESPTRLNFQSHAEGMVVVKLTGSSDELSLMVEDDQGGWITSFNPGSEESVVFNAQAGMGYTIDIATENDQASFELILTEANRETLELEENEYYVALAGLGDFQCGGENLTEMAGEVPFNKQLIVNWDQGYFMNSAGSNRQDFASVTDLNYTTNENHQLSNGNRYSLQLDLNLLPEMGTLNGTAVEEAIENVDGDTSTCTGNFDLVGRILL